MGAGVWERQMLLRSWQTWERFKNSELMLELSFLITLRTENDREAHWVVQTDNTESRRFWAYGLAWVVNKTALNSVNAIILKLKAEGKIFVLVTRGATADSIEPTDRHGLFLQVDER